MNDRSVIVQVDLFGGSEAVSWLVRRSKWMQCLLVSEKRHFECSRLAPNYDFACSVKLFFTHANTACLSQTVTMVNELSYSSLAQANKKYKKKNQN